MHVRPFYKALLRTGVLFLMVAGYNTIAHAQDPVLSVKRVAVGSKIGKFTHGTFPSLGRNTHLGVDLVAPCGNEVRAWVDGVVTDIISSPDDPNFDSLGYMVIISHGELSRGTKPMYTTYFHLQKPPSSYGMDIKKGEKVFTGQEIGKVGKTGVASGCHLHFEIRHFSDRFHPAWGNVYGKGDKRRDPVFLSDWTDPAKFDNSEAAKFSSQFLRNLGDEKPPRGTVEVKILADAPARDLPSAQSSASFFTGTEFSGLFKAGVWVTGLDGASRWFATSFHSPGIDASYQPVFISGEYVKEVYRGPIIDLGLYLERYGSTISGRGVTRPSEDPAVWEVLQRAIPDRKFTEFIESPRVERLPARVWGGSVMFFGQCKKDCKGMLNATVLVTNSLVGSVATT